MSFSTTRSPNGTLPSQEWRTVRRQTPIARKLVFDGPVSTEEIDALEVDAFEIDVGLDVQALEALDDWWISGCVEKLHQSVLPLNVPEIIMKDYMVPHFVKMHEVGQTMRSMTEQAKADLQAFDEKEDLLLVQFEQDQARAKANFMKLRARKKQTFLTSQQQSIDATRKTFEELKLEIDDMLQPEYFLLTLRARQAVLGTSTSLAKVQTNVSHTDVVEPWNTWITDGDNLQAFSGFSHHFQHRLHEYYVECVDPPDVQESLPVSIMEGAGTSSMSRKRKILSPQDENVINVMREIEKVYHREKKLGVFEEDGYTVARYKVVVVNVDGEVMLRTYWIASNKTHKDGCRLPIQKHWFEPLELPHRWTRALEVYKSDVHHCFVFAAEEARDFMHTVMQRFPWLSSLGVSFDREELTRMKRPLTKHKLLFGDVVGENIYRHARKVQKEVQLHPTHFSSFCSSEDF